MGVGGGILKRSNSAGHDISKSPETSVFSVGGLASTHFSKRVINVSNAPPVSLKKTGSGEWEIKQGSGGLVSCVDPVMSKDCDNMWLANLGVNLRNQPSSPSSRQQDWAGRRSTESPHQMAPATNSLGLPLIRQAGADVLFHVLEDDSKFEEMDPKKRTVRDEMSLLGVLHNYNRGNYKLNPVIVTEEDYNVYYGGISNGLLWPALHNLPEYIVKDYDDIKVLQDHWHAYVRVNYQFAINAVRNSRPQDFIWIHDYHLLLTGMIMQSLDQHLEVGFFLHIPFQPPANFFEKYGQVGTAVLRGILRFTKVGFQTHRDRAKFVELVEEHLGAAKVKYDAEVDIYTITHEGWMCSLGVFPVSIKNEDFLSIAYNPETIKRGEDIRKRVMSKSLPDGKLFFSVERFDYTKGIKEKLLAYWHYFEQYPDRLGKDVLFQIAVMNRRSVDTYRQYQDECIELAEKINGAFSCPEAPEWKPLIFQTDGLPRSDLVAHYLAMDLGLVTPKKDGMNLVAKEMLVCNPRAGLILSTGAGSEIQFSTAGLFQKDGEQCYKQINDVYDVKSYAEAFYAAATEPTATRIAHGKRLHKFILAHDIERWSAAFLDPSWTHEVIRPTDVRTLDDFYNLMMRTRNVRRQIVERVLKGIPIRPHFSVSLRNAKESLALSCKHKTKNIVLRTTGDPDSKLVAHFDIQNELEELDKDLNFLEFVQSDEVNNVEQFVETLKIYHPVSPEEFKAEVQPAIDLLYKGDHFHFFFTDRDGTLKSYSCSYPASIQPAYSGVIQAQFARRCAQTCAILTTAPLMHIGILDVGTIPEGYYYYGASAGREWFIDPSKKFKDNSIPEADIALLDQVFSRVAELLDTPEYKHFTWIGSGLQKHCGHLTIAHQDIHGSVDRKQSRNLHDKVCQITIEVDPLGETLTVSESETDIKVFLKAKLSGMIFNKGHGIKLLCEQMQLDLREGNVLVCGDSETDLPMLEQCLAAHPAAVYTIWVTRNEALKRKVTALCDAYDNVNVAFVSCPEVLLGAMAQATIREIKMRPRPPPSESSDEDNSVPQSPVV
uniref:alpha,alpha-trehalose-phosphate synthase (UDP-forming) n=1 Tax=Plectus sambesii TaxID=2011161 RepID=A0A914WQH9_9BILA